MKTETTLTTAPQSKLMREGQKKAMAPVLPADKQSSPDYKVDLSMKAPPLPGVPALPKVDIKTEIKEVLKEAPEKKAETIKRPESREGSVRRPAVFFIKGLDVFSSPSKSEGGYAGVGRIAEAIEGSRIYGWDQKDEMIKEIKKVHRDYPVVLVGHSLGGDTAVEIADELDSLEQNFRKIDLLVTIDAVGFSHDIIPQNVKKHLNVFGENTPFLKDGPHVARREETTSVRNILSPHDHTDIDDDREIQYEIVSMIQDALKNTKAPYGAFKA